MLYLFLTHGKLALDEALHLLLDGLQVLVAQGLLCVKVIVEAALNPGPNGDLGPWMELLDCHGHDVSTLSIQTARQVNALGYTALTSFVR